MSQVAAAVQRIIAPISEDLLAVDREVIDDLQSDIPLIKKISDYIVTAGGKRMRPIVLMLIARALGYQGKEHIFLATMINGPHSESAHLRNCCRRRKPSFRRRSHPAAQHP